MPPFDEHLFGRIAVLNGFLTREQLQECLEVQRSSAPRERRQIGEIMRSKGYLNEDQLNRILDIRKKKLRKLLKDSKELNRYERSFGMLALKRGLVKLDQLESALLEQERLARVNLQLRMGEILVSMGFMNISSVLGLLNVQHRRILVCPSCDCHFTVVSYRADKEYRCDRCKAALEVPVYLDSVQTDSVIEQDDDPVLEEGEVSNRSAQEESVSFPGGALE